jgi:PEP-CTERM motif
MTYLGKTHVRRILGQVARTLTVAATFALLAGTANAGTVTTFTGQDDGASAIGPFPTSSAAQTSFESAASSFGSLNTITFESQPVGYNASFTAAPGVTVSLTGLNDGNGFSGISNTTFGNLYGFNTTPGGSNWLGFPEGTATFSFADPTNSFGFFLTGLQTDLTAPGVLMVTFTDGTSEILDPPVDVNGGAQYFGFTDTDSISSITINNLGDDAWGIDDVTYNVASTSPIPEPSSLLLLGTGVLGLADVIRRKVRM